MIKNDKTAIGMITESSRTFYLTGSRFFRTDLPGSDYDFFTQADSNIVEDLRSWGFNQEPGGQYADPLTISVWVRNDVHVQVVSNAEMKNTIQEFLNESGILKERYSKAAQRLIWKVAILSYQRWT